MTHATTSSTLHSPAICLPPKPRHNLPADLRIPAHPLPTSLHNLRPKAKKNNVLFFFWEHPNYSRIANKSVDPYPANECGTLPASIEDFGFDWRGKIVAKRPGKGKGKAAGGPKVTCFPLLDDSAGAGADGRPRIDPTPTNPLGLQA